MPDNIQFLDCLNRTDILEGDAIGLHLNQLTFVAKHLSERLDALEKYNGRRYHNLIAGNPL